MNETGKIMEIIEQIWSEKMATKHKQGDDYYKFEERALFMERLLSYCNSFKFSPLWEATKITLVYAGVGSSWILFSDVVLASFVKNHETILLLSIVKGWAYVFLTAILIFMLVLKGMKRNKQVEDRLVESIKELSAAYSELEVNHEELIAAEEERRRQMMALDNYSKLNKLNLDRLNRAQAMAHVGNWELDIANFTVWASEEAFRIYGLKLNEEQTIPLKFVQEAVHPEDRPGMDVALDNLILLNKPYNQKFRIISRNEGQVRHIHSIAAVEMNEDGRPERVLGVIRDITEIRKKELAIENLAYKDALTNLPNRVQFIDRLTSVMEQAGRTNTNVAVAFLDVDSFKKINDTLGHTVGDGVLQKVSARIQEAIRGNEILARFDGDKFVVCIPDFAVENDTAEFVERIRRVFKECFRINDHFLYLSSSIGMAVFPENGNSPYDLLKNADAAMYKAKESGRNTFQLFDDQIIEELTAKFSLEKYLRKALTNDELFLEYQPQIEAGTGRIRGCEALLRWNSPELGRISPEEFISVAEDSELIIRIGEWVLRTACQMNADWQKRNGYQWIVSVNISPIQLKQKDFVNVVTRVLEETKFQPELLELEVTENMLIDSFLASSQTLEQIKQLGIRIALDDFGTGYSSLSYLRKLQFHTLKIDKVFVQNIMAGSKEELISASIISLAHSLGMEVIAEGVETEEQLKFLQRSNCDEFQGYLLCKPISDLGPMNMAILQRHLHERIWEEE